MDEFSNVASFPIVPDWKCPPHPPGGRQIIASWLVYVEEYYSGMNRNEICRYGGLRCQHWEAEAETKVQEFKASQQPQPHSECGVSWATPDSSFENK